MREPRGIEQCWACGKDVAIYSDRQLTPEGPMCPACRRKARQQPKVAPTAPKPTPKPPCPHRWAPLPRPKDGRTEWCLDCWEVR